MNEKLILRAAVGFRAWMVSEFEQPQHGRMKAALRDIKRVASKSREITRLTKTFIKGTTRRSQICENDLDVVYGGIINDDKHKLAISIIPNLCEDAILAIETAKIPFETQVVSPLSLKGIIEEVRVVSKRWKKVEFRDGILSVLIESVTLSYEDDAIELGSFRVSLDTTDPMGNVIITSIDKVKSHQGHYHPHVDNSILCEGDGTDLLQGAISRGHIEDYFSIVESILRTYNANSAYTKLGEWYESDHENEFYCEPCDIWRDDETSQYCSECGSDSCSHCVEGSYCGDCSEWRCDECSIRCSGCSNSICLGCNTACCQCKNRLCSECARNCTCCSDSICEDCMVVCEECKNNFCSACTDNDCHDCNKEKLCDECESICDKCGVTTCPSCGDNHECLLTEATN